MNDELICGPQGADANEGRNEGNAPKVPEPEALADHSNGTNSKEYQASASHYLQIAKQWCRGTLWKRLVRPWLLNSGFWTAAATVVIAVATVVYTHYARKQWEAMNRQLSEMQAEQRAWVYADIRPDGAVYKTQGGGFGFPIAFVFQNSGHLPAQSVSPYFEGHTSKWFFDHHENLTEAQQRICQQGMAKFRGDKERIGSTVFPNQPQTIGEVTAVDEEEWNSGSVRMANGTPMGALVEVAGCILYTYGDKIGTSGFAFSFARNGDGRQMPFNTLILPYDPTTVPAGQITITGWPVASVWRAN